MKQLTEADFLRDVSGHKMHLLRDDGLNRHIRFKKSGTTSYQFDLITWQGHLCYTGDMGTYVFARLEDMFEFFRTDREYAACKGKTLGVNLGYWAEKLLATDSNGPQSNGAIEFDQEKFKRKVLAYLVAWMREHRDETDAAWRRDLWHEIIDSVIEADDGEVGKLFALQHVNFNFPHDGPCFEFDSDWLMETDFKTYTWHYQWACHAIAWGVMRYDEVKKPMTLDDAIAHAEAKASNSPCGQEHAQLAVWLRDYRDIIAQLEQQRDELLAALERIASTEIAHKADALWDALCMRHAAKDAVASVKGGA